MSEQDNTRLVQQAYEHFKSGNIQAVLATFSEDVEWHMPEIANVPFARRYQGREQVGQFFAAMAQAQEPREFEPREFIAQGDRVVALGHYTWQVKATGKQFRAEWAHVYTVRGGRIVAFREYTDTALAATAHQRS